MTHDTCSLFNLQGKNALIMCGGHGAGLQAARALGKAGARVMLAGKNADELENAVQDLQDLGIDARWVQVNGTLQPEWLRAVTRTLERMGDVHILVNYLDCTQPDEGALLGAAALTQYVVTQSMLALRRGTVVNLLAVCQPSGSCETPMPTASNSVQHAAIQLTRSMAAQWRGDGIRVNAVGVCAEGATSLATDGLAGAVVLFASDAGQQLTGQWLGVTCCEDTHNGD